MGAVIPALATVFAPAAGGAAAAGAGAGVAGAAGAAAGGAAAAGAGVAAGAGLGSALGTGWLGTIAGGVISGVGSGLIAKKEAKAAERRDKEEYQRRQDSYQGAGEAMRFWEQESLGDDDNPNASDPGFQRADANSNENLRVGQTEQAPRMGEKFRTRKAANRPERFRYDRSAGQIVPA